MVMKLDILRLETLPLKSQISLKFYNLKRQTWKSTLQSTFKILLHMGVSNIDSTYQTNKSFHFPTSTNTLKIYLNLISACTSKKENQIGNLKLYKYFHYNSILGNTTVLCTNIVRQYTRSLKYTDNICAHAVQSMEKPKF